MPQRPSHLWVITFSRFRLDGWKRASVFYRRVKSGMHVSFRDVCCRGIGHDLAIFRSQVGVLFFHQEPFLPNSAHQVSVSVFFFSPLPVCSCYFCSIFPLPRNCSVEIRSMCALKLEWIYVGIIKTPCEQCVYFFKAENALSCLSRAWSSIGGHCWGKYRRMNE